MKIDCVEDFLRELFEKSSLFFVFCENFLKKVPTPSKTSLDFYFWAYRVAHSLFLGNFCPRLAPISQRAPFCSIAKRTAIENLVGTGLTDCPPKKTKSHCQTAMKNRLAHGQSRTPVPTLPYRYTPVEGGYYPPAQKQNAPQLGVGARLWGRLFP